MKISIAVTNVSPLVCRHKYKPSRELLFKLARKFAGFSLEPNITFLKIEECLRKTSFCAWFCNSTIVSNKMRIISRSIVNSTCKKFKCVQFRSNFYNYFHKQRGVVQESKAIHAFQLKHNCNITDHQKKCG